MNRRVILWLAVAVIIAAVAYLVTRPSNVGFQNVDEAGVQKAIAAGAQAVDVRTVGEYQMGHIPGAINAPVDVLEQQAQSWDRDAVYVVYCTSGSRSATAVRIMESMGFKNVLHFSAGIQAWNGELETGGQASAKQIETSGKPVMIDFYTDS